ncbi:MAG: VanZ family protein [Phycisphaerae bacterium]
MIQGPLHASRDRQFGRILAVLTLLLAYASLLPFQFSFTELINTPWREMFSMTVLKATGREDLIINLLAYVPIGLVFGIYLKGNAAGWLRVALFAGMLSVTLERLQTSAAHRYASAIDVALNTSGALAGYLAAPLAQWGVAIARRLLIHRPWTILSYALTTGLIAIYLLPGTFITNTDQLWKRLAEASCTVLPNLQSADPAAWTMTGLLLLSLTTSFGLGFTLTKASCEQGERLGFAFMQSTLHGAAIISVIFILQVFTAAPPISLGQLIVGGFGCMLGGVAAVATCSDEQRWHTGNCVIGLFLMLQLLGGLLVLIPSQQGEPASVVSHLTWFPFHQLWSMPGQHALRIALLATLQTVVICIPLLSLKPATGRGRRDVLIPLTVASYGVLQVALMRLMASTFSVDLRLAPAVDTAWPLLLLGSALLLLRAADLKDNNIPIQSSSHGSERQHQLQ